MREKGMGANLGSLSRAGGRGGFSLLELLVALTILAFAIIPVAYFYTQSVRTVSLQQQRARALMLAEERMNEILALSYDAILPNNRPAPDIYYDWVVNRGNPQEALTWDEAFLNYNPYPVTPVPNPYADPAALPPIFNYPLPYAQPVPGESQRLPFNPYDPRTQGYDTDNPNQEYEPIGFYLGLAKDVSVRFTDPRRNPVVDDPISPFDTRSGTSSREELFAIYGRRTIIMEVVPRARDDDSDPFPPSHPKDGGTLLKPTSLFSGPADKFVVESQFGNRGKLVIVQVFWLKDQNATGYVPREDLYMVELKNFIPAQNTDPTRESFDFLNLGTGESLVTTPYQP